MRHPCFVVFVSFAALVGVTPRARAESAPAATPSDDTGLALYLFGGYSGWDATALEAPLAAMGYSAFSADPGTGGVGLSGWSHDWMGGIEFQLASSGADAPGGRHVSLDAGQVMFRAGRVLASHRHLRTYVLAGLGTGASSLSSTAGPPLRVAPGIQLSGKTEASNYALALQSLVGVDYLVPFNGKRGGRWNGVFFGLRAGYNLQPVVSSWTVSRDAAATASATPVGLPRLAADGPFVHLLFGDIALGR